MVANSKSSVLPVCEGNHLIGNRCRIASVLLNLGNSAERSAPISRQSGAGCPSRRKYGSSAAPGYGTGTSRHSNGRDRDPAARPRPRTGSRCSSGPCVHGDYMSRCARPIPGSGCADRITKRDPSPRNRGLNRPGSAGTLLCASAVALKDLTVDPASSVKTPCPVLG